MQLYMTFVLKVKWPLYFLLLFQSDLLRAKMVHRPVGTQLHMEPGDVSAGRLSLQPGGNARALTQGTQGF